MRNSKPFLAGLVLVLLALSACGGGSGGGAPPPPPRPRDDQPPPGGRPPPAGRAFTPDRELVIGYPQLSQRGRAAEVEAQKVRDMHNRGGTGRGQIVGLMDSGANMDHLDLAGQYAHVCAMGWTCNDRGDIPTDRYGGRNYSSPLWDRRGHGTNLAGVVAAKKNDHGVYGIAHEARIVSYGNDAGQWHEGCPHPEEDCNDEGHGWGGIFDRENARGVRWMQGLGVRVVNNSWGRLQDKPGTTLQSYTAERLRTIMAGSLPAYEAYVAAGGVMVWANGNRQLPYPSIEAALPHYFPGLEAGWLAVAGLDGDRTASDTQHCGPAADWCIAAPVVMVTTELESGLWELTIGTSLSAPYVAASLAGLKSMFPNLDYHQIRRRILATAERSFAGYSREVYGQGRLDLDAASRPVGGTNFALGARDTGPVASAAGARAVLPRPAIRRYFAGRTVTVLDGFQRAPFRVPLDAFAEARSVPYLSMDDLRLAPPSPHRTQWNGGAAVATAGGDFHATGFAAHGSLVGFGRGAGAAQGMARLAGAPLPAGGYRMSPDAAGIVLGFAGENGAWRAVAVAGEAGPDSPGFGAARWTPETVLAAAFVPDGPGADGAEAFGISFASELDRPMGWDGSGALEIEGDSVEFAWRRNLAVRETVRVDLTNRLTHLAVRSGPLLQFDDALLASAEIEVSFRPHRFVTVEAWLGTERPVFPVAGRFRAAAGVDESGGIAYRDVAVDGRDLLSFDNAGLRVRFTGRSKASFNLGVAAVRDGFGQTEALAGALMDLKF